MLLIKAACQRTLAVEAEQSGDEKWRVETKGSADGNT